MLDTLADVERFLRQHLEAVSVHRPNPLIPEVVLVEFADGCEVRVSCRVVIRLPCEVEDAEQAVRLIEKRAKPLRGGVA